MNWIDDELSDEDIELVVGATISAAVARLEEAGMGAVEVVEFLVQATLAGYLSLDSDRRFQRMG